MENIVSINNTKPNTLEFDVTCEGLETKGMKVRFCIKAKGMDLQFAAKKAKGDSWGVKLPVLPMLDKTAYNFHIEVISDGYYFEVLKGTVNVVGSTDLYSTAPKNVTLDSTGKKEKKPAAKKKVKEEFIPGSYSNKPGEKSIEQIANEMMEASKERANEESKKESLIEQIAEAEKKEVEKKMTADDKVRAVLQEAGIIPKKKPSISKFSIKTKKYDS